MRNQNASLTAKEITQLIPKPALNGYLKKRYKLLKKSNNIPYPEARRLIESRTPYKGMWYSHITQTIPATASPSPKTTRSVGSRCETLGIPRLTLLNLSSEPVTIEYLQPWPKKSCASASSSEITSSSHVNNVKKTQLLTLPKENHVFQKQFCSQIKILLYQNPTTLLQVLFPIKKQR